MFHLTSATAICALAATAVAAPFSYPLANGFPAITSQEAFLEIEQQAGGPTSTGSTVKVTELSAAAAYLVQVVGFEELFETAFFTQFLQNLTEGAPGFTDVPDLGGVSLTEIIAANQAVEELHTLGAQVVLKNSGQATVLPCKYDFPITSWQQAIRAADDFTSLVLGAIQPLEGQFANDGGAELSLVPHFAGVAAIEGQQDGFYRYLRHRIPVANSAATVASVEYMYNHVVQNYVVPGTCNNSFVVPEFNVLKPLSTPMAMNTTLDFRTTQPGVSAGSMSIAYTSGQAEPFVVPITNVLVNNGTRFSNSSETLTTFTADFPFAAGFSRGLTIAALVEGSGPFIDIESMTAATLAGPGLIQVG